MDCLLICRYITYIAFVTSLVNICHGSSSDVDKTLADIQKLMTKLFAGYDNNTRPTDRNLKATDVEVMFLLQLLLDFDETKYLITHNSAVYLIWFDNRLAWNMSEYDIHHMPIPLYKIWTPDVVVFNAHGGNIDITGSAAHAYLRYDGIISILYKGTMTTHCGTTIKDYPNDNIMCEIMLTPWVNYGSQVNLMFKERAYYFGRRTYNTNPRWEIKADKYNISREVNTFECEYEACTYTDIIARVYLKRKWSQELSVVWAPCVLSMVLTMAMFWIPHRYGVKMFLCSTITSGLLLLSIYVSVVTRSPLAANVAASFMERTMCALVSAAILQCIVHSFVAYRSQLRPPNILRSITSAEVLRFALIQVPPKKYEQKTGLNVKDTEGNLVSKISYPSSKEEWQVITDVTDRVLFALYLIIFVTMHQF